MDISHYFEWEDHITGGHYQSVQNQRRIMDTRGIEYTKEPRLDVDVLHLNNLGPKSLYYARRAKGTSVSVVVHAHQTAEDFRESFLLSNQLSKPLRPYLEYGYALADRLICPSEHNRNVINTYTDVPKTVISNGFDHERLDGFEALRDTYLERYDLEPPVVFNVGHVIQRKGLSTFVEMARKYPDLTFAWFGYLNPTNGRFDRLLKSRKTRKIVHNAPENCVFTGYVDDIRGAYAAGDIFFFPTKNENEGMALLEAMSCGIPPVVRDIPTFEWLEDGETCLKTDSEFGRCIERLTSDDYRQRLGRNAAEKSQEFRLENIGDQLVDMYTTVA